MQKSLFFILTLFFVSSIFSLEREHIQYLSPSPNATHVSRHASIIVRFSELSPQKITNLNKIIAVNGQQSGKISGYTKMASDERTITFNPETTFTPGEKITVEIKPIIDGVNRDRLTFTFSVARKENCSFSESSKSTIKKSNNVLQNTAGGACIMPNGISVPSDFPHVNVSVNKDPAEGYIFINNWGGTPYNVMFNSNGSPVWYLRTSDRRRDFKVQKNGTLTMLARDGGERFLNFDQNFNLIDEFEATNGYSTDEHECIVLENGHVLLLGRRTFQVDMSKYVSGGKKNATVRETAIQEFTEYGELIFQWPAWENFDPRDMIGYSPDDLPTHDSFRFPHMNSIDIDDDANIILSSKRLSEVTKIDRQTGEMIWRLGGANNDFDFVDDPLDGFYNQHSVRVLGNGHYTIFDNGCLHNPQVSRALEYEIDPEKGTATLVWSYMEDPPTYAYHMGNAQRLLNGNTFINWAIEKLPKAMEVTPDGDKVYEMNFVQDAKTYRAFRFPWNGTVEKPYLIVEPTPTNVTLIFNKFGDPDVDYYRIYGDTHRRPTKVIATSEQTLKKLTDIKTGEKYYFRVTAVNKDGSESDFSNEESADIHFINPGTNMVTNGTFDNRVAYWTWLVRGSASAVWSVEEGVFHFKIDNGGGDEHDVQIRQAGLTLVQGEEYLFEFDAWASAPRTIEAKIGEDESPWTNYSKNGLTPLSTRKRHFSYSFEMQDQTDYNARVVINTGKYEADVYIDNISLKLVDESNVEKDEPALPSDFILKNNYPNPFNSSTTIAFHVPEKSGVNLSVYNIAGQMVENLIDHDVEKGWHRVGFESNNLSSGLYFIKMHAQTAEGKYMWQDIKKMSILK